MISEFVQTIAGWLTPHEGQFLYKVALKVKNLQGVIVEIGSYCGKSTIYLASTRQKVYAVDPHQGNVSGGKSKPTYKQFQANLKRAGLEEFVIPVVKTSERASVSFKHPVKLLFIDGLHDELHAQEDFRLWSTFVIDDGIIAMHDAFCGWEGAGDVATKYIVQNSIFGEIGVIGSIIYGKKGKSVGIFRIKRLCDKFVIELCNNIYKSLWIPKRIQFVLVHRFLRIFLLNEFTSFL